LKTQDYFAAPFLLHRKLNSVSSSHSRKLHSLSSSIFFLLPTPKSLHFSLNFFLSFFSMLATPFFYFSYFPSCNSGPKGKQKTKTESGEDEGGLAWVGETHALVSFSSAASNILQHWRVIFSTLGWYRH
jgi:hypothetical protein